MARGDHVVRGALVFGLVALVAARDVRAQDASTSTPIDPEDAVAAEPDVEPDAPVEREPADDNPPVDPASDDDDDRLVDGAATDETTPRATPPAPVDPGDAAEPPEEIHDGVRLRFSPAADAELARCVPLVSGRREAEARACLERVRAHGEDTTAALRADALREVLDVELEVAPPPDDEPDNVFAIPPGRLELSSTTGLFGVWNGVAGGIAIAAHLPGGNPALLILGTGVTATLMGVGYGVGGYFLADALDLGEGDSRLVASGLVWGTSFGIAALPAMLDIVRPSGGFALSLSLATIVGAGFLTGGAALGLSTFADFSTPEVSLINTGGWMGSLFGLLTVASLAPFAPPLPLFSAGYLLVASSGLFAGGLLGQLLDLTWGESLLLDLGGVLGTVITAAIVMSLAASGAVNAVPSTVLIPVNSVATAAGTLLGAGAGLGTVMVFRGSADAVFRPLDGAVSVLPPTVSVTLDQAGEATPLLMLPSLRF